MTQTTDKQIQQREHKGPPRLPVSDLLLDPENPRLASVPGRVSQKELLKTLWSELSVDEVGLSIAANGFFDEEPLFVIPAGDGARGKFIVVEGNRRLAAVQLLCDDKLREEIGATDLPRLSERDKDKLKTLPVSLYNTREELWRFLGFTPPARR